VVAGGVPKEIAEERVQELTFGELPDARTAAVENPCHRDHLESLTGGEAGSPEPALEPCAEVDVLPPCRCKLRVESSQRIPYVTPEQPRGRGRLFDRP
jgi:hypothetical protein